MSAVVHDAVIYWPNGMGERACSSEYRLGLDAQQAICPSGKSQDDLTPAEYNLWHTIQHRLDQMHDDHLGIITRYDEEVA